MKKLTIFFFILGFLGLCSVGIFGQEKKADNIKIKYERRIEKIKKDGENLSPPDRLGNIIISARTGQWDQPSTWVGGVVPNSDDDVEIRSYHTITIDTNQNCNNLDIDAYGGIVIISGMKFYIFGNLTNSGVINATSQECYLQFCGTNSQSFTNKGVVIPPINNLSVNNPNGLSISSNTGQINVLRVNLFWGTITNSSILTIGNGGTTYGTIQRGAPGSTFPAGSFDNSPGFNIGSGGLNLIYTISSTEIYTGYEVPPTGNVNYIYTNFVTTMTSDINVIDSINLAATTFSISGNTLTINNRISYSGGILYGDINSNLIINGSDPLSISVFNGLNNLTVNNPGGVNLDTSLTISGTLTLANGQLTNGSFLTLANNAEISVDQGSLTSTPFFGSNVDLIYSGSSPIKTSFEMPTSASVLRDLTITNTSSIIQAQTPGPTSNALALQSFEDMNFPPTGWTNIWISGSAVWAKRNGDYNNGGGAQSTPYNAYLFSNQKGTKADLITPAFDCSNSSSATLTFYHKQKSWNTDQDSLALYVSNDGGSSWVRLYTYQTGVSNWTLRSWSLGNYISLTNNMKVKFHGCAEYGYGVCVDEVKITKTGVSTPSTVTVKGSFTINSGTYSIGNNTLVLNGSIVRNSGTAFIGGASSTLKIGGSVSGSTLPPVNNGLYNFTVNRSDGVILGGPINTNSLTLTAGKVTTTSVNLLTVTGTTTSSVQTTNGYVNGPLAITLPASLPTGYTYQFPIGKSTSNKLELLNPTTTTGGTVVLKAEVNDAKTNGSCGNQIASIDTSRYWSLCVISGASNFTNTEVRVTYAGITTVKAISLSTTGLTGIYHYIGRWVSGSTIRSSSYINLSISNSYIAIGTADNNYGTGSTYTGNMCFANSTLSGVSHPTYGWYDPVASGHTLISESQWSGTGDDGYFLIPNIGFNFSFFGNNYRYSNVYICTNGYLSFGARQTQYWFNDMFPSTSLPPNIIAGCLLDLDVRTSLYSDVKVYYGGNNSTYFAVTFVKAHAYGSINDYVTFQIILFSNGNYRVQFNYSGYSHGGGTDIENTCLVGSQNLDRTKGIQYRYNSVGGPVFSTAMNLTSNLAMESGGNLGSLPVELVSFNSAVTGRNVKLSWSTSKEQNNSGFEVLRRNLTEEKFSNIGFVEGKGTVSTLTEYTFSDNNLKSGKYYYRIKQIDYNGNSKEFDLKNDVSIGIPTKYSLSQNFPNPFNASTKIRFDICKPGDVKMKIYDISGREIATLINQRLDPDYYEVTWNALDVSSGAYFVRIIAGDFSDVKKMVLVK